MPITNTNPRIRLVEAIVEVLAADPNLISLTDDGEPDDYGARHRIGEVLNEASLKGRTPYVGVQILNDFPLIPNAGRAHVFRSDVLIWTYSKNEFRATQLADRIQYLLTSPGDDDCFGFLDFTNDHIRNMSTEFESRDAKMHDNDLDLYAEAVQFRMVWSDVPCDGVVDIPQTEECDLPQSEDPDTDDCLLNFSPTSASVGEQEESPFPLGSMTVEGGTAPYVYTIVAGDDRDNFSITGDALSFVFSGPLTPGDTYTVVIRATDANGNYVDTLFTVTIVANE